MAAEERTEKKTESKDVRATIIYFFVILTAVNGFLFLVIAIMAKEAESATRVAATLFSFPSILVFAFFLNIWWKEKERENMSSKILFSGKLYPLNTGGISNEKELVSMCPAEFKEKDNVWSNYARMLFCRGADIKNWQWNTEDEEIRTSRFAYLRGILRADDLEIEDRKAVAGWMLSEMLTEVPEYIPAE